MPSQHLQGTAGTLAAAGLLALVAGTPALAAGDAFATREVRDVVESLRNGSMTPAEASASCLQALEASGNTRDYREVMTTFLDVPADEALPALCRAVVQGVTEGSITEAQLRLALDPRGDDSELVEFGRLLRAIFFSHRMTAADGAAQ